MKVVIFNKGFESKCRHIHKRYATNGGNLDLLRKEADKMKKMDIEISNQFTQFANSGDAGRNNTISCRKDIFTSIYIIKCVEPLCNYINDRITFDELVNEFNSLKAVCSF